MSNQTIDIMHPQAYRRQVADLLRTFLQEGNLGEGDRLPPLRELARKFGVSIGTVSKAIGDLEKEGLVISRPQVGVFVASKNPTTDTGGTSKLILLLTTFDEDITRIDSGNTFWQVIVTYIMKVCRQKGFEVLHSAVPDGETNPARLLPKLVQDSQKPVGLIFQGRNIEQAKALKSLELPTVFPHCMWSPDMDLPRVCLDGAKSSTQAVEYLVGKGHKDIGYVGPMQSEAGEVDGLKFDGYREAMEKVGLKTRSEFCWPCLPTLTGAQGVCGALVQTVSKLPSAFVVANDLVAIGLISSLKEKGLSCPEDVSVIGCDNLSIGEHFTPSLTTFGFDRLKFAVSVVDMLIRRIKHPTSAVQNLFFGLEFIKRLSA